MVEKSAIPTLLQRKVDRTLFKEAPLPELKGADLINSLVSSGILDAAQGEQIARIFSETGFEDIKRLIFTDLTKTLSVADSPNKLNSLREIARVMTENFAALQLLRAPELADDGSGFKTENTDQLELENLYALFLFSIVEPAIAELEAKLTPPAEKPTPPSAENKPDLTQSEQTIAAAEVKLSDLDTERQRLMTDVASCDPYNPSTQQLATIQTRQSALEAKLVAADLDKEIAILGRSKGFLEKKLGTAGSQDDFDQINDLIDRIDKFTGAVAVFRDNMTTLGDEIWGKRVLLDVPEVAELDKLYHDGSNRNSLFYAYRVNRPEIVALPNNSQKSLAACLVFHRDLSASIVTAEAKIASESEARQDFVNTYFIAPARSHLQKVEELTARVWDSTHKRAFPELDEARAGSLARQILDTEPIVAGGFVGKTKSNLEAMRDGFLAAKNRLEAEVTTFAQSVSVGKDLIDIYLKDIYEKADQNAEKLNEAIKSAQQKEDEETRSARNISTIKTELSTIAGFTLAIELENDEVDKHYAPILAKINLLLGTKETEELLKLKEHALRQEFDHRCRAYSSAMVGVEKQMPAASHYSKFFKEVIDVFVISRCGNIIKLLESMNIDVSEETRRLQEIRDHYGPISNLAFSWKSVRDPVLGVGAKRSVFIGGSVEYNNENHPIQGKHITALVRNLNEDRWLEGGNVSMGTRTVMVRTDRAVAITNPTAVVENNAVATESEVRFTETSMGWCMRLFDKIYQEKPIVVDGINYSPISPGDGKKITGNNMHGKSADLVDFVFGIEVDRARRQLRKPSFDRHLVERAFRLHITSTMNHSYLATSRAAISDELYYMFNWINYAPDYQLAGTGKFNFLPTAFIFGFDGISPLQFLDPKGNPKSDPNVESKGSVYAKMAAILREKGYLNPSADRVAQSGFTDYRFLLRPFISLVDVSPESPAPRNIVMNPPLRYFPIGYNPGTTTPYRAGSTDSGLMLTLDDMRTTDGERLYELMNFDVMGELNVYYNQLGQNGLNFLLWFMRCEESEFLANVDESKINDMKNQAKFTLSLFPKIGNSILWGEGDPRAQLERNAINKIVVMLIFIKCLIKIDRSRPKGERWDLQNDVNQFLLNMFRRGVISEESKNAIFDALSEAYRIGVYLTTLGDKLLEQVKERAKVRS